MSKGNEESLDECLSTEDLAAFQEGSLPREERNRIEAHLARCPRCRTILKMSIKSERHVPDPETKNPPR